MPKIIKRKRLDTIKEVVTRWGNMDSTMIKEQAQTKLGIDDSEYNIKTFYRDLKVLVDGNEIVEQQEGGRKIWSVENINNNTIGATLINKVGGDHYIAKVIQDVSFALLSSSNKRQKGFLFYFVFPSTVITMQISDGEAPFKLLLSRTSGQLDASLIKKLHDLFGKRLIVLRVPYSCVSGVRENHPGHALICVNEQKKMTVHDLSSRNGTAIGQLEHINFEEVMAVSDKKTSNVTFFPSKTLEFKKIQPNIDHIIEAPSVVVLGNEMRIFIRYLPEA
ncbi:MAG: hypothetical protein HQK52_16890 [Oligoflexia bacterium]|nr:hypothetical protein [Oligoflexia bacterium]